MPVDNPIITSLLTASVFTLVPLPLSLSWLGFTAVMTDPACTCLDPWSTYNATSNTCLCKGSLLTVQGECATACKVCGCPPDQYINSTSSQPFCSCKDPFATIGSYTGKGACLPGFVEVNGRCVCPAGQQLDNTTNGEYCAVKASEWEVTGRMDSWREPVT